MEIDKNTINWHKKAPKFVPIIVLCRYNTNDVLQLQQLFSKWYNKNNIYFINSSQEIFENNKIKNIYTEQNGNWNDNDIWKKHIDELLCKFENK